MKGSLMFKAIKLIYPDIQGGYSYWETKYDGTAWDNLIDGLVWNNTEFEKPSWEEILINIDSLKIIEAKRKKKAEINEQRDFVLNKNTPQTLGVYVSGNLVNRDFQVNASCLSKWTARIRVLEQRIAAGEVNPTCPWIDYNNDVYELTLSDFKSLVSHLVAREDGEYVLARLRKNEVDELDSLEEIETYDITKIFV